MPSSCFDQNQRDCSAASDTSSQAASGTKSCIAFRTIWFARSQRVCDGPQQFDATYDANHGRTANDRQLPDMAHIHQCHDLVESCLVIDADGIAGHRVTDDARLHPMASRRILLNAEEFFQPVSGWRV